VPPAHVLAEILVVHDERVRQLPPRIDRVERPAIRVRRDVVTPAFGSCLLELHGGLFDERLLGEEPAFDSVAVSGYPGSSPRSSGSPSCRWKLNAHHADLRIELRPRSTSNDSGTRLPGIGGRSTRLRIVRR